MEELVTHIEEKIKVTNVQKTTMEEIINVLKQVISEMPSKFAVIGSSPQQK